MFSIDTINTILFASITVLLIIACYMDIKERNVSNKITLLILVFSIPLIYLNLHNIGFFHFAYLGAFYWGYTCRGLGGADLKAMFPLIFAVPNVMVFVFSVGIIGVLYIISDYLRNTDNLYKEITWNQVSIPFFIPILIGFQIAIWS